MLSREGKKEVAQASACERRPTISDFRQDNSAMMTSTSSTGGLRLPCVIDDYREKKKLSYFYLNFVFLFF